MSVYSKMLRPSALLCQKEIQTIMDSLINLDENTVVEQAHMALLNKFEDIKIKITKPVKNSSPPHLLKIRPVSEVLALGARTYGRHCGGPQQVLDGDWATIIIKYSPTTITTTTTTMWHMAFVHLVEMPF